MLSAVVRGIVLTGLAAPLAGCLSFGSIEGRGTTINDSVGVTQNRGILLNLVRASRQEPLYFLSINSVQAQSSADLKLGLPAISEGPGLSTAQKQFTLGGNASSSLDNNTNTNFQMGVYSSKDFYAGLLAPLGPNEIDLLFHQGFSRELIFYLVIDKVKITNPKTHVSFFLYNDPTIKASSAPGANDPASPNFRPSYALFEQAIESAMVHGLTTEVPQGKDESGKDENGTSQIAAVPSSSGNGEVGKAGAIQFVLRPQAPGAPQARLCFERALATPAARNEFDQMEARGKAPNYCGESRRMTESGPLVVSLFGQDVEVEVTTRSIYSIFNYLGLVLAHPNSPPMLVDYGLPSETTPSGPLLTVTASHPDGGCFSAVTYAGRSYCVPQEGAETTKRIFNVLSALVALKQSPGDLPQSQTVLVTP